MDMQGLVNAMGETSRLTRSQYHLTLGKLIAALNEANPQMEVVFDCGGSPGGPHSYRGYYSDLSFPAVGKITAGALLALCNAVLGSTLEGYKGGDFLMKDDTPLWHAAWGSCGLAIVGIGEHRGKLVLETKNIDV